MKLFGTALTLACLPLTGCVQRTTTGDATLASVTGSTTSSAADVDAAYAQLKGRLMTEIAKLPQVKTVLETIDPKKTNDENAAIVAKMAPPDNVDRTGTLGRTTDETPEKLKGVYWLRGSPKGDYLMSFANIHLTTINGQNYGFLPVFAPGTFVWKELLAATGAPNGDFTFVPEECRVPKDDPTIKEIAKYKSTFDSKFFARPLIDDFEAMKKSTSQADLVDDTMRDNFINRVANAKQDAEDGSSILQQPMFNYSVYYEAIFSADYSNGTIDAISAKLRDPKVPRASWSWGAKFSYAPHLQDKDIYVRKSYLGGAGAGYYLLTRVLDGAGKPTPHFGEFLACVAKRSQNRLLPAVR